jgi:signal transduction histidine kinase
MKSPLTRLSLQRKFLLITFLGIVLLTGTLGYLSAHRSSRFLQDSVEKQGRILARTVASLIINELVYEKLGLVEEGGLIDNYVREIYNRKDLDFLFVAVLDENNRIISHNDFSHYGETVDNALVRQVALRDEVAVGRSGVQADGHDALEFAAPLSIGGKHWGILQFAVSLKGVEQEIRRMIWQIAGVTVTALIAGLALILLLNRRFISPITEMAAAMREIDSELPDRKVEVHGEDELAKLGLNFNNMVDRIREASLAMKRTHEKLLQSEKLATLGILSSSVAHRINNPLGGLFNCLRMLEKYPDDPSFQQKYIGLIREGMESIRETVQQLLWTAGKRRTDEARAAVEEVLAGVMHFLDYRLKGAGVSFQAEVTPGLILPIPAHDLQEILQNVLLNAVQAMPDGGALSVLADKHAHLYRLEIKDSGIGIPAAEVDRIFDLFYTTKPEGEGTGLGLWMTYELVKKCKGEIVVKSTPGVGTTVTITIPEL